MRPPMYHSLYEGTPSPIAGYPGSQEPRSDSLIKFNALIRPGGRGCIYPEGKITPYYSKTAFSSSFPRMSAYIKKLLKLLDGRASGWVTKSS